MALAVGVLSQSDHNVDGIKLLVLSDSTDGDLRESTQFLHNFPCALDPTEEKELPVPC